MNYYHDKTIELINTFGMQPKKIAEILGKSKSLVYAKIKQAQKNSFNKSDFETISDYIKKNITI